MTRTRAPGGGRKPADPAEGAADTTINLRVTTARKARLAAKAERAGMTLSAWMLHAAERAEPARMDSALTAVGFVARAATGGHLARRSVFGE